MRELRETVVYDQVLVSLCFLISFQYLFVVFTVSGRYVSLADV